MSIVSPFDNNEIKLVLFLSMDIDTIVKLYPHNRAFLEDPFTLASLTKKFGLPSTKVNYINGIRSQTKLINSFADLVFLVYLHDPAKFKYAYVSYIDAIFIAIKINNYSLFKRLLEEEMNRNDFYSISEYLDTESLISDQILKEAAMYQNDDIFLLVSSNVHIDIKPTMLWGWSAGKHNDKIRELLENSDISNPYLMFEGIVDSNNIEILREYFDQIITPGINGYEWNMYIEYLGTKNQSAILNMILTNNNRNKPRNLTKKRKKIYIAWLY
jgi:hypothetical protein